MADGVDIAEGPSKVIPFNFHWGALAEIDRAVRDRLETEPATLAQLTMYEIDGRGPETLRELREVAGAQIIADKIADLGKHYWGFPEEAAAWIVDRAKGRVVRYSLRLTIVEEEL